MRYFCSLLLALVLTASYASGQGWARQSQGPGGLARSISDRFGNVFLGGSYSAHPISFDRDTLVPGSGNNYVFVTKYDHDGNVRWARGIGRLGCSPNYSMGVDAPGNLYVCVEIGNYVTIQIGAFTINNNIASSRMLLIKYDSTGTVLWVRASNGNGGAAPTSMSTDPAGHCYILGTYKSATLSFGRDTLPLSKSFSQVFLAKYDSAGNSVWGRGSVSYDYSLIMPMELGSASVQDAEGHIYITGSFSYPWVAFGKDTLRAAGGNAFFLYKFDTAGKVLWARTGEGVPNALAADKYRHVYMGGHFAKRYTYGGDTLLSRDALIGSMQDLFVTRFDPSGNTDWVLQGSSPGKESCMYLATDTGGGAYMTFLCDSNLLINGITMQRPSMGRYPVGLLRLDTGGQVTDTMMLHSAHSSHVSVSRFSDVYITGALYGPSIVLAPDTVRLSTSTHAVYLWQWKRGIIPVPGTITTTAKSTEAPQLIPNPSGGRFLIRFPRHYQQVDVIVIDMAGRTILARSGPGVIEWPVDLGEGAAGMYLVRINGEGHMLGAYRMVVQ